MGYVVQTDTSFFNVLYDVCFMNQTFYLVRDFGLSLYHSYNFYSLTHDFVGTNYTIPT